MDRFVRTGQSNLIRSGLRRVVPLALLAVGLWALALPASRAADDAPPPPFTPIPRVDRPLTLEGIVSGDADRRAVAVKDFVQHDPREGEAASQQTTAYLAYDHKNLYVGFICLDSEPQKIRAHVTRRDAIGGDDHVGVVIDTYYDHRRGYAFAVNVLGIQEDSLVDELRGEDQSFETLWHAEVQLTPKGYATLLVIPFTSLRFFPSQQQTWGIVLIRSIPRYNEFSTWPGISRSISGWLIQEAEARGLQDISPGKRIQLTPYGFCPRSAFWTRKHLSSNGIGWKRAWASMPSGCWPPTSPWTLP